MLQFTIAEWQTAAMTYYMTQLSLDESKTKSKEMKVQYIHYRDCIIFWYQILMPLFLLVIFIANLAIIGSQYDW